MYSAKTGREGDRGDRDGADGKKKAKPDTFCVGARKFTISVEPNDVLFGRGTGANSRRGNIMFRSMVKDAQAEYSATAVRGEKTRIARNIVRRMHATSGRFLRKLDPHEIPSEIAAMARVHDVYLVIEDDHTLLLKTKQAFRHFVKQHEQNSRTAIDRTTGSPTSSSPAKNIGHPPIEEQQPSSYDTNVDHAAAASERPTISVPALEIELQHRRQLVEHQLQRQPHNWPFEQQRVPTAPSLRTSETAVAAADSAAAAAVEAERMYPPRASFVANRRTDILSELIEPAPSLTGTQLPAIDVLRYQRQSSRTGTGTGTGTVSTPASASASNATRAAHSPRGGSLERQIQDIFDAQQDSLRRLERIRLLQAMERSDMARSAANPMLNTDAVSQAYAGLLLRESSARERLVRLLADVDGAEEQAIDDLLASLASTSEALRTASYRAEEHREQQQAIRSAQQQLALREVSSRSDTLQRLQLRRYYQQQQQHTQSSEQLSEALWHAVRVAETGQYPRRRVLGQVGQELSARQTLDELRYRQLLARTVAWESRSDEGEDAKANDGDGNREVGGDVPDSGSNH